MAEISIRSIVSARNEEPYVQIKIGQNEIQQLTVSEARNIANDLYLSASRSEMDAMLLKFWKTEELPMSAVNGMMRDFRDYRLGFDLDKPETKYGDPDDTSDNPHKSEDEYGS